MAERSVSKLRSLLSQTLEQSGLLNNTKKVLVFVDKRDSVKKGFDVISHENVLSAPVWDSEHHKWVGIVDIRDFLHYVLSKYGTQRSAEDANLTVDHIMNMSKRNPLVPIPPSAPLLSVLSMFDRGLHRVLVSNSLASQEATMLSQSSIIKWLDTNRDKLGTDVQQSLENLGVGVHKHLFTISNKETAYNAFKVLRGHNVHGLPIVDEDQKIWGNMSLTDLRYAADNLDKLSKPLMEFFQTKQEPLTCTASTRLIDAIGKLAASKVHRLHVINQQRVPVGVVSLTDIMDIMLVLSGEHEGMQD